MEVIKVPGYVKAIARRLRRTETEAEKALWFQLRSRSLNGAKFRRQHPIGRYIADFYCHASRLVIEVEGSVHDETDQKEYDAVRSSILEEADLRILRFQNNQVLQDLQGVLETIINALNSPHPKSLSLREREDRRSG